MKKLAGYLLFSISFLLVPWGFAQDSNQSSSDSGVLVSPPIQEEGTNQESTGNNEGSSASGASDQGNLDNSGNQSPRHADVDNGASSQNDTESSSNSGDVSKDEIVVKSTEAVISQMTANLKLTQDQINAVRPIVEDNIVKVRALQQKLGHGDIDGKTMVNQRTQLTIDEDKALSSILTPDQLKLWVSIQDQ